jgi:hypothetical protein
MSATRPPAGPAVAAARVVAEVRRRGWLSRREALLVAGGPPGEAEAGVRRAAPRLRVAAELLIDPRRAAAAERRLLRTLEALHRRAPLTTAFRGDAVVARLLADDAGRPPSGHRGSTPVGLPPDVIRVLLDALAERGAVERAGRHYRIAGQTPRLAPELRRRADELLDELRAAGVSPPPATAVARRIGLPPDVLAHLRELGELVAVTGEIEYPADVLARLRAEVARLAESGPVSVSSLRDALGTSRRYAHALLMDRSADPDTRAVR